MADVGLRSSDGSLITPSRLSGSSVIFCYPWSGRPGLPNPPGWDDIPGAHGSTPQAQAYAALFDKFVALELRVFGLSLQPTVYQREFVVRCGLPFPLLSDAAGEFTRMMELPTFVAGGSTYLRRLTLFARDATITGLRYPVPDPAGDAAAALALLAAR